MLWSADLHIDKDECASSPCANEAACTDSHQGSTVPNDAYTSCRGCVQGFANGMCAYEFILQDEHFYLVHLNGNCDIDVEEYVSSPCVNGETCMESVVGSEVPLHTYGCTCAGGFANGVCEYDFIIAFDTMCS
eukprot:SAG11_NODE_510_length_8851_cov_25.360718_8_plen_133_part_00